MDHNLPVDLSTRSLNAADLVAAAQALTPVLRERAEETEALRRPPEATRLDLKRTGIHRILQPARFGGAAGPFHAAVEILSAAGRGCGSTAWILAQNIAHNMMVAQWPDAAQHAVWDATPDALISGILIPGVGRARPVPGGYVLSGRWPFLTGVDICDWAMFTAFVTNDAGEQVDLHFLLPREQFTIHDTWRAMGLRGSCSNDVSVDEVFVPTHMTAPGQVFRGGPTAGSVLNGGGIFLSPCYAMFGVVIGSAALGIAEAAVQSYVAHVRQRNATMSGGAMANYPTQQVKVAHALSAISAARKLMLGICDDVMGVLDAGREATDEERTRFRSEAAYAGRLATEAVNLVWDAGGGAGVYDSHPLSRLFRDTSAANRHITMSWDVNASAHGRVALGLPIDNPAL
jgi:3-hydroxy-9,10-secoandrosta-1,3,5(10)-triene-9,17-dione monooxygenase